MMSLAPPSTSSVNQNNRLHQKRNTNAPQSTQKTTDSTKGIVGRVQRAVQSFEQNIWLPDSPATFAFYIVAIAVLCGGLFLHINLSAQITSTQYRIAEVQRDYYEIERESAEIVSQVALATSMFDINNRARMLGYVPVTDQSKNFVAVADIQVPQPQVAATINVPAANKESITIAEAFAATGSTLAGSSQLETNNAVAVSVLPSSGSTPASPKNSMQDRIATQLREWWTND